MFELTPFRKNQVAGRNERNLLNLDSLFEDFFNDSIFPSFYANSREMKVDIKETENEFIVEAELPGLEKQDVKIEVDDDRLTISANKQEIVDEEKDNYIRKERRSSSMSRSFRIENVDRENVRAKFTNGILSINLPKLAQTQIAKKEITIE